jgi:hypothetical protein
MAGNKKQREYTGYIMLLLVVLLLLWLIIESVNRTRAIERQLRQEPSSNKK